MQYFCDSIMSDNLNKNNKENSRKLKLVADNDENNQDTK